MGQLDPRTYSLLRLLMNAVLPVGQMEAMVGRLCWPVPAIRLSDKLLDRRVAL
jgi:hypothetical protein